MQGGWFETGATRLGAVNQFGMVRMRGGRDLMMAPAGRAMDGAMPPMAAMKAGGMGGGAVMERLTEKDSKAGSAAPTRVREYFPETMLWQPALITDDQGRAELPLRFADSITT